MQGLIRKVIRPLFMLLMVLALLMPAAFITGTPQPAQADDLGAWVLQNGKVSFADEDQDARIIQEPFSKMKVNVILGTVSADHSGPVVVEIGEAKVTGTISIKMRGSYSSSSGMSGSYTYNVNVTWAGKQGSVPMHGTNSGTFSGPGGIAEGQLYTVSFSGGQGTVSFGNSKDDGTGQMDPFSITYTVAKGGDEQAPGPVVSSLPPISGMPTAFIEKIEGSGPIWVSNESEEIPPSKRKWVKATSNMPLGPGYTIRTSTGASAIFRYRSGAVVKINPKSWFGIQEPTVTKSSAGEMNGRLWQGISNFYFPKGAAAEKKWGVETNMAIVGIKGTSFVLEAGDTGTNLKVLEGSVEFTHKSTGKSATVEAGSSMTASSTGLGQKSTFNLSQEKAKWTDLSSYAASSNGNTVSSSSASSNQPSNPTKKKINIGPLSCFIATAAYGSETAAELDTLRTFRDRVLMQSEAGRLLVDAYYQASPPLAEFIAEHEEIRTFVREGMLDPIVTTLNAARALWDR